VFCGHKRDIDCKIEKVLNKTCLEKTVLIKKEKNEKERKMNKKSVGTENQELFNIHIW
jgi:hypothetical protein